MPNPVLVEILRANSIESRHRGAVCVMDAEGKPLLSIGDVDAPVFPRSAIKSIQALPLIESGAADAFGFEAPDLALACASHSGEQAHIDRVRSMLKAAGRSEADLECGGHWSSHQHVLLDQCESLSETPGAVFNNCSGKHAGFVATAAHLGISVQGYIKPDHPVMSTVRDVMAEVTGAEHHHHLRGTDGCSIPTYAIPLTHLARGFAKMATGEGLRAERATAAKRLFEACMSAPFYVAGTKRFCTSIMESGQGRLFVKTGAEGVFCGAIPELGIGIALKCDDGASRASEAMMAAALAHLLPSDDALQTSLASYHHGQLKNWNGIHVGDIRASVDI